MILRIRRPLAFTRALSQRMDRIAQGPEDVKKSVRTAMNSMNLDASQHFLSAYLRIHGGHPPASRWKD
jgi:hypothetical protein